MFPFGFRSVSMNVGIFRNVAKNPLRFLTYRVCKDMKYFKDEKHFIGKYFATISVGSVNIISTQFITF